DDIGRAAELLRRRDTLTGLEVEGNALLVAVHRTEGAVVVGLAPHAERIAAVRRLDLDDLGAEVRQQHAGERPAYVVRELQDADAVQRAAHAATGLNLGKVISSVISS